MRGGVMMVSGLAIGFVLPVSAVAQPVPAQAAPVVAAETVRTWWIEGGRPVGKPSGELDEEETSEGFHVQAGVTVSRWLGVFAGLRVIDIETHRKGIATDGSQEIVSYRVGHRDLRVGARASVPATWFLDVFGEVHLSGTEFSVDHPDFSDVAELTGPVSECAAVSSPTSGRQSEWVRPSGTLGHPSTPMGAWEHSHPVQNASRMPGSPSISSRALRIEPSAH